MDLIDFFASECSDIGLMLVLPYTPVYKTHFLPSIVCLNVGVRLIHAIGIFQLRKIDPKCRYSRHPVYCYVMANYY